MIYIYIYIYLLLEFQCRAEYSNVNLRCPFAQRYLCTWGGGGVGSNLHKLHTNTKHLTSADINVNGKSQPLKDLFPEN
jgi:cytochrome c biogenesis factor